MIISHVKLAALLFYKHEEEYVPVGSSGSQFPVKIYNGFPGPYIAFVVGQVKADDGVEAAESEAAYEAAGFNVEALQILPPEETHTAARNPASRN